MLYLFHLTGVTIIGIIDEKDDYRLGKCWSDLVKVVIKDLLQFDHQKD